MSLLKWTFVPLGCLLVGLISCKPSKNNSTTTPSQFTNAVYVSCEGNYGKGNADITLFNRTSGAVVTNVYFTQNALALGDICQSLTHIGSYIYCVVNNSNKIEVVNDANFTHQTTITSLNQPRYMIGVSSNKAYVSEWSATGDIAVIDLTTNTVKKHIATGNGPEQMIQSGNYLFVANCGGLTKDSTVTVIDINKDSVISTIKTGFDPTVFAIDNNNYVWVLCAGYSNYSPPYDSARGALICIDPSHNFKIVKNINLPFISFSPRMIISSDMQTLYFNSSNAVYAQPVSNTVFSNQKLINRSFYSIGIDPITNYLYASNANFIKNGNIIRYNPSTGKAIDSFICGISAGNFLFK